MTVIIASKLNGHVYLARDSLTIVGDLKMEPEYSKITTFEHFCVAAAGEGPFTEALEEVRSSKLEDKEGKWKSFEIKGVSQARAFQKRFVAIYKETGNADNVCDIELLIVTKDRKIFYLGGEQNCFEVYKQWAIGSGSPYALGCLQTIKREWETNLQGVEMTETTHKENLKTAIEVACDLSPTCGLPAEVLTI